ncbi:hypothetical protein E8E12_007907 [Didymella heteroderae]|uniref:Heterokaryon incompatibility domain-containing protein n=1 Tax=Didymella heteroderae TaxID=1769908 RepID=A0A9P5BZH8_9PLEO|nr:hypothetical protein E8E12_007907 [Didymella heteroderae]
MTFLELDQEEQDRVDLDNSEDERNVRPLAGEADVKYDSDEIDVSDRASDDSSYTIWEDDEDAYHTFSMPSFFATSLEVEEFQIAMRGYKPTNADLGIVRSWLDECHAMHVEKCHLQNRQYVRDLKVIDCAKRAIVPAPPDCPFVALSYVWGSPSAQPDLTSPGVTTKLPQTIEDSITVTLELGFTYLWIDRYCINQDDEQEKQEQIAQMADIYASAEVTIIAAAGEDPSHGLAGVRKNSRGLTCLEQVRSIRLFSNPPIEPRDRYSPYYVHGSKWASRAWTFQECYNSPRRLFFTTEQITLICNTAAFQETAGTIPYPPSHPIYTNLRGWVNAIDERPLPEAILDTIPYPLASIMDSLMVYNQRQMSYDSDALNAILGTLNTFTRHGIHHIWGVPMLLTMYEASNKLLTEETTLDQYESETQSLRIDHQSPSHDKDCIALLWHNHSPCYRRAGFPSWSPLGWKEEFPWLPRQGIGWSSRQTPEGFFLTLLSSCHGIETITKQQPQILDVLSTAHYEISGAVSHQLVIEARTVDLRLALSPDGVTSDVYRDCIATEVGADVEVLLAAMWDKHPWEMDIDKQLKGLFLTIANSEECCAESPHHAMIIMEQHDGHWERVAIALIANNYLKPGINDAEPTCAFTTAYEPLPRQVSTGAIYTWDQHSFNGHSAEPLDLSNLLRHRREFWWTGCSQMETITLH